MAGDVLTQTSIVPAVVFLLPMLAGTIMFSTPGVGRAFQQWLSVLTAALVTGLGAWMASRILQGVVLTTWNGELRVDALSALMVIIIGGIGMFASLYSVRYLVARMAENTTLRRTRIFHGLLMWFFGTMLWGCVTNNVIMLYVAIEATTLTSGLLVAFYWDRRALEAGYKYLMLLTIGITFALFGCVLLYAGAAATHKLAGGSALLISDIRNVVPFIPSRTAAITIAFLVIGFGTKAGIAPFHPWLPDAHAEAPTPISVLLSGVMINMALYAMARTVSIFYPAWPQVTVFIVVLGTFSMLLGIILALAQDDLKRLLAYSSVSQMGYVLVGIGLGTYLGCYGGLFHLLNHALYKSLLFMCVGAVIYATGVRRIAQLGGLRKQMPITSACFFLGALAIAGFPPLNGFWSKLTVYLALARAGMWWAAVIAILTSFLTMVVMLRAAYRVFGGEPRSSETSVLAAREVPALMWFPMVVLAAMCGLLGIWPQGPYPLLDRAAKVLATLGR
ncbi:MAG TPA: proton-conducting transporter membrane subunit [Candidatus Acidoferrum sp.]|nr:proton-conducting transporter membrane subunit [Candidatus Acidoferrum sp.]